MLTEDELMELCQRHQLTDVAITIVRNIRESNPSRNVRSGTHNVVTHYASRKMGCVVKAEARSTELAAIYRWDHDRDTYEFYDQPPRIKKTYFTAEGRARATSYTPDFFVLSKDFIGWVECKEEGWLVTASQGDDPQYFLDEQGRWRCPAAEAYALSNGLGFMVSSSSDFNPILTQNISDLSDYYRPDCPRVDAGVLNGVRVFIGETGWCWLRDLLQNGAGIAADQLFKLIVDEQLFVDLSQFLLMKEAHRVRVFRTQVLLDSSEYWLPSLLAPPLQGLPQVAMVPGTQLLWDGKACEILNVGHDKVYLKTADSPLIGIECEPFAAMVREGVICGTQEYEDPRSAKAAEVLRQATDEDLKCASHRYYCLHLEFCPPGEQHVASERGKRKWRAIVQEKMEEIGNEFVALIPEVSRRGNRMRRLDTRTLELMHEVIDTEVTSSTRGGNFVSWSTLVDKCGKEGRLPPSRRTFETEIRRVTTPEELKKAREGEKAGYNLELPYLSLDRQTPKHGCRPFDIAHIDHTMLDLQFVDESTGQSMKKAWLTVLIDAFTRTILAWVILFDPPSYRSCMLVIRDCVRRHGRFPSTVVADQGSDFKSKFFDMLVAFLGSHKRMRPASHPRYGSIIERFFGMNNTDFVHALRGNNQALQSPRSMSASHNPVSLAVWNLRAFREAFEGFLAKVYHATEHPALGISPDRAMEIGRLQSGARSHTLISYGRDFVIATMPTTQKGTVKIQNDGSFKVNSIEYHSGVLVTQARCDLEVKYDPFDASRAYVLTLDGWVEGLSPYTDLLAGRSEKEIEAISLELNELNSRTGIQKKEKAQLLGSFMNGIREREGSLAIEVQSARDREQKSTYAHNGLLDTPLLLPSPADAEAGSNVIALKSDARGRNTVKQKAREVFRNTERKVFGDFE